MKQEINTQTILTLDAGGTNFVFSALKNGEELGVPICKKAIISDLEECLYSIIKGFEELMQEMEEKPSAISFAFPGASGNGKGIIPPLNNLHSFNEGVPLGQILENHFQIPVYINNDANLYAYGEATSGILQEINKTLKDNGNSRNYKNVIGVTIGTGFGTGIVSNGNILNGDNAAAGEVFGLSNRIFADRNAEACIGTKAITNNYEKIAGLPFGCNVSPKDLFDILEGRKEGNIQAARESFQIFGNCLGDAIANLISVIDGIVVIGGGLTGAEKYFMPSLMHELRNTLKNSDGIKTNRLLHKVYFYGDEKEKEEFLENRSKEIPVPGTTQRISFDITPRTAVAISKLGANKATSIGAYNYAISQLIKK